MKEDFCKCRHPKENKLFIFSAVITVLILIVLFIGSFYRTEVISLVKSDMISTYKADNPEDKNLKEAQIIKKLAQDDKDLLDMLDKYYWFVILLAPFAFLVLVIFAIGKRYGDLRGNSVRLDKHHYPQVDEIFTQMAKELGFKEVPELYLVSGSGTLNAYATCVPGYRNFAAIYSDILERCLAENDMETLKFILGHELGHIKLNHVKWWYTFLTIWANLPVVKYLIGLPMGRAREYGCDNIGKKLSKNTDGRALIMLASGKHAYKDIDLEAYTKEHFDKKSFWEWVANLSQDHGFVSWRIAAIRKNHQAGLFFKNREDNSSKDINNV
ncbi:MAG: M48 family metallopeptidase [Campylobacteraceae bacterium]|nr:M48 family metallopeptidase [Campylobacteraceae bacterium]